MENLFVVRHGETWANESDTDAGSRDYPLDKKGKKAVSCLADQLSKVRISAVYSSPVFRALETAKIVARPHELGVQVLDGLTDAQLKSRFVGKKGRHHILTDPEAFAETYDELQERVVRAVDFIRRRGSGNVVAVSHGDVIVALLHYVVERKIERNRYYVIHPDPASLSIVELRDKPNLVLFNYRRKPLNGL